MSAKKPRPTPRDRNSPIQVYVNEAERATIAAKARATGLTLSAYLRTAGTAMTIKSVLDLEHVGTLAQVSGDQDRLRLALAELMGNPDPAARRRIHSVIARIDETQEAIRTAARKVRT